MSVYDSTMGKVFVIAYALITIVLYGWSFACGTELCKLFIVLPIMPWAFVVAADFGVGFPWAVYPIFILLNATVAYTLGTGVEWILEYVREKRQSVRR